MNTRGKIFLQALDNHGLRMDKWYSWVAAGYLILIKAESSKTKTP